MRMANEKKILCPPLPKSWGRPCLVSGKDVLEIERILSVELGAVNEWLCENRLSLHLGKTQSILFGSKKRISKCSELHVTCNGSVIGSESEVTYLGAILDQTLSGASTARL